MAATGHFDEIRPSDVREFAELLACQKAAERGREHERPTRPMTAYSIRAHLFALSNLYRRAQQRELVPARLQPRRGAYGQAANARQAIRDTPAFIAPEEALGGSDQDGRTGICAVWRKACRAIKGGSRHRVAALPAQRIHSPIQGCSSRVTQQARGSTARISAKA